MLLKVSSEAPLIESSIAFAQRLVAKGVPIAVATNSHGIYVEKAVSRIGRGLGWGAVIKGNQVQFPKPNPEIFLLTARVLGVKPADCLVFEDSPAGFYAASSAGMGCVLVRHIYNKNFVEKNIIEIVDKNKEVSEAIFALFD